MTRTMHVAAMIAGLAMSASTGMMAAAGPVASPQGEADMMDFSVPDAPSGDLTAQNGGRWGSTCKSPQGPIWSRTPTAEEAPRSRIMRKLYDLGRYRSVITANDCPCHLFVPPYDTAEAEMFRRVKGLNRDGVFALERQLNSEVAKIERHARSMCRPSNRRG